MGSLLKTLTSKLGAYERGLFERQVGFIKERGTRYFNCNNINYCFKALQKSMVKTSCNNICYLLNLKRRNPKKQKMSPQMLPITANTASTTATGKRKHVKNILNFLLFVFFSVISCP